VCSSQVAFAGSIKGSTVNRLEITMVSPVSTAVAPHYAPLVSTCLLITEIPTPTNTTTNLHVRPPAPTYLPTHLQDLALRMLRPVDGEHDVLRVSRHYSFHFRDANNIARSYASLPYQSLLMGAFLTRVRAFSLFVVLNRSLQCNLLIFRMSLRQIGLW
jgi:hypothetical protein